MFTLLFFCFLLYITKNIFCKQLKIVVWNWEVHFFKNIFFDDFAGIDEIAIDLKGKKLTIIGTVDPVTVASKLRKYWQTDILLVGPAKEPEKKEEPKKEEPKKEEAKKEEGKEEAKKEEPKKEEGKKEPPKKEDEKKGDSEPASAPAAAAAAAAPAPGAPAPALAAVPAQIPVSMQMQMPVVGSAMPYRPYYPPMHTYYQVHHSIEENPNACVIS